MSASGRVARADDLVEYARRAFRREIIISEGSRASFALDFIRFMRRMTEFSLDERSGLEGLASQALRLADEASALGIDAELRDYLDESLAHLRWIRQEPAVERDVWRAIRLQRRAPPTMAQADTLRYCTWLASEWYTGAGEVVELGTWLGATTKALLRGLKRNAAFHGRCVHAFDTFRWASWMTEPVFPQLPPGRAPRVGESFLPLFHEGLGRDASRVRAEACVVPGPDSSEYPDLPDFAWTGGRIELMFFDLGTEECLIERVWRTCEPAMIPGQSVFVINTYGNMRSEGIRRFTRRYAHVLRPMHKPRTTAKGFLVL